ncbi:hypothetical protein M426DRAFT_261620 [Hypoxylon sp. CI-4A]|nr:hypothetical protein M426DRAFT_261620 [Hypoxylon sp. CI-4A]
MQLRTPPASQQLYNLRRVFPPSLNLTSYFFLSSSDLDTAIITHLAMPVFTPSKASAACSRGLTRSHTLIPPIPFTPPNKITHRPAEIIPRLPFRTPMIMPKFPEFDRPKCVTSPLPYSPIRTPFSPTGPFPSTPSTPFSPSLNHIVSPLRAYKGARERRRESRPNVATSPRLSLLTSKGLQLEAPKPQQSNCRICEKTMTLLPAIWCAHTVSPSRMKDGMRVVRIPAPKPRKRPSPRKPNRIVIIPAKPSKPQNAESKKLLASSPRVEARPSKHVARSAVVEKQPAPLVAETPIVHPPFKNPDLNDKPLHWSPSMFKPEIDRHNWTWSEWDSPSRPFEDVSYQTDDWPIRNPFPNLPPGLQEIIKQVRAMKASAAKPDVTADSVRYEKPDFASSFSSGESTSKPSEFSSWVDLDYVPWNTSLLERFIDSEQDREKWAERRRMYGTPSTLSPSNSDASARSANSTIPSPPQLDLDNDSDRQSSKGKEVEPRQESSKVSATPSAPLQDASAHSESPEFSSWVDVDDRIWDRYMFKLFTEKEERVRAKATGITAPIADDSYATPEPVSLSQIMRSLGYNPAAKQHSSTPTHSPIHEKSPSLPPPPSPSPPPSFPAGEDSSFEWNSSDKSDLSAGAIFRNPQAGQFALHESPPRPSSKASTAARQHFQSLPSPSIEVPPFTPLEKLVDATAPVRLRPPPTLLRPVAPHQYQFHTLRQLPSAIATEPRQPVEESRGSGFGWKSLACVAATAAAVGAGLAYAWFSG